MTNAMLFDNVMRAVWGDNDQLDDFIVRCVYDKVRGTARINPENAFEVLDLFGPEYVHFIDTRVAEDGDDSDTIHTVVFPDRSTILVIAKRGIGSAVEVI